MRLVIDMQAAQSRSAKRGIGRYSKALVKALLQQAHDAEIILLWNANLLQEPRKEFAHFDVHNIEFHAPVGTPWLDTASIFLREKVLCDTQADILLLTSLFEGIADNSVTSIKAWCPIPTAVIFYDLIPLLQREYFFQNEDFKQWYLKKLEFLQKADRFLAISDSSAQEAKTYLHIPDEQVINISSAVDTIPEKLLSLDELQKRFSLRRPFLMHASACDERKNFKGLIQAFALLPSHIRRRYQLVLVCNPLPWQKRELQQLITAQGLQKDEVIITGYVDDTTLFSLYKYAHLFVFPSLHEGFGLPILEAMHMDTPVIASNTSSMPEVVGYKEALFDPQDTAAIAATIRRALEEPDFYEKLRQNSITQRKRFSWQESAKSAWEALWDLYKKTHSVQKAPPKDLYQVLKEATQKCPTLCERRAFAHAMALNARLLEGQKC